MLTALRFWKTAIAGRKVVLHTDNTAVFHGLQKSSMRGKAMTPLREVKLLCAQLDVELILRWVPTKENLIADLLSRRDFGKLANFAPQLGLSTQKTAEILHIPLPPESLSSLGCSSTQLNLLLSATTHPPGGTNMSNSHIKPQDSYGGASASTPDAPMPVPAKATLPSAPSPGLSPSPRRSAASRRG